MKAPRRRMGLGTTVLALFIAAPALAQENIDEGKSPAQLYAQNCAICHKSPHGLSKAGGVLGVQNFLREHYTASRESAAAIAGYLATIDRGALPRERARVTKHTPKNEKAKAREEKSKKAGEAKTETKPDSKPAEQKPEEAKLPPSKPPEAKTDANPEAKSESKPAESKAPESKPGEADAKTGGAKASSDAKPEKKPD